MYNVPLRGGKTCGQTPQYKKSPSIGKNTGVMDVLSQAKPDCKLPTNFV
jgi:hypothetical protein